MRLILFIIASAAVALLLPAARGVRAQSDIQSVEVGAQFSALRIRDILMPDPARNLFFTRAFDKTVAGIGGRVTYNVNERIAIDGEINFFPKDDAGSNGRKPQGLLGPKAGFRSRTFGIFGKARPGFLHFKRALDCPNGDTRNCATSSVTNFALDLGGVIELYPSTRTILRFDLGDTIIFYREREFVILIPEPGGPAGRRLPLTKDLTHNLQFSVGVGFRF
jgi:hypothetical protein